MGPGVRRDDVGGEHVLVIAREKFFAIPYPRVPREAYDCCVLSDEGALSGKRSLKRTERKLAGPGRPGSADEAGGRRDRKSTRLNSSHVAISYAVSCLKRK